MKSLKNESIFIITRKKASIMIFIYQKILLQKCTMLKLVVIIKKATQIAAQALKIVYLFILIFRITFLDTLWPFHHFNDHFLSLLV